MRDLLTYLALLGALILPCSLTGNPTALAQDHPPYIRAVRIFDPGFTLPHTAGLAFSPQANAFLLLADHTGRAANLLMISPFEDLVGSAHLPTITSPINMAYDSAANRLLLVDTATNELHEIKAGPDGPDPTTIRRFPAGPLGLQDPQGMAFDPISGQLFILDSATADIVRVEADGQHSFDPATALAEGRISRVGLSQPGLGELRGLAFNPTNGHLYFLSLVELKLYEVTETGQFVASRDMAELDLLLRDPQGMVVAPSGDSTDDPAQMSLYLVDSGLGPVLTPPDQLAAPGAPVAGSTSEQGSGRIIEFTLTPPVETSLQVSTMTASLVNTIDTSQWSPPSPDPSGLTYLPNSNRLMMSDGEVEETVNGITHFQGANVWEFTLDGRVVRTANISKVAPTVVPMTNEPAGVTWNPANGHYFFSDDDGKEVYDLNPGADGLVGTADDTWTHFDTQVWGNGDPEGIAFDTWNNRLFVADGVNREVYQYTLSGTLVSHFDVQAYGVEDPESVEFNPDSGTLFVMSSDRTSPVIVETTTSGALLQTINISAADARAAAGLAYAPASDGSGTKHFYIVDRGIDNNSDPNIIDGKIYEMTAPSSTPVNTPPVANNDSASTSEDTPVIINVAANDTDPDGNLNPASATTACGAPCDNPNNGVLVNNGNGSFTYTPNPNFNGSDSFVYQICDTIGACDTATVSITVNPVADPPVANNDSASTTQDTPVIINVAANDTDPDGNLAPNSANSTCANGSTGCNGAANGSLTDHGDGTITYTPNPSFIGSDSFVYEICDTTSLCDTASVSLTVTPTTSDLIFADGFESGNLSAWSASQTDGGDLSVSVAAALVGSNGMQAVIDNNKTIFVTDDTPNAEPRYGARFYFDPNSISMANGNAHFIFEGYTGTSTKVLQVEFRQSSGSYQVRARLVNDSTTWTNTSWFTISDTSHFIELDWRAATAAGANDGGLTLWIDGTQLADLTGVDNDTRRIDRVRLGAVAAIDKGTRGTYYFDAFESRRQTYIGP